MHGEPGIGSEFTQKVGEQAPRRCIFAPSHLLMTSTAMRHSARDITPDVMFHGWNRQAWLWWVYVIIYDNSIQLLVNKLNELDNNRIYETVPFPFN